MKSKTCEICEQTASTLFVADGIADFFGIVPYYDEFHYLICGKCLKKLEGEVSSTRRHSNNEEHRR